MIAQTEVRRRLPPLVLSWDEETIPLPVRPVRAAGRVRPPLPDIDPPGHWPTGPAGEPFDFGRHVRRLAADVARRCPDLGHIDVSRMLFGATQARSGRAHGLQARVTPLRCRNGQLTRTRRGVVFQVQRYLVDRREMLYLVTFCLPRFLDQSFDEKLVTLFHELFHINPAFDGDLRRHDGRCSIHSRSQKGYDAHMARLARDYLSTHPDPTLHSFLRLDFGQLLRRHGRVLGVFVPRPKLVPVASEA